MLDIISNSLIALLAKEEFPTVTFLPNKMTYIVHQMFTFQNIFLLEELNPNQFAFHVLGDANQLLSLPKNQGRTVT